jgi:ankyrin repeat protein
MLLRTDKDGSTAWHLAAYGREQDVIENIWVMAKEKLTTQEIRNEMLLRTDNDGRTVWHFAALFGQQDILKKIWNWAKSN